MANLKSAVAQGLLEAADAAGPGPLNARLVQAAMCLEEAALTFTLIERMAKDGDPGITQVAHQAQRNLMAIP